MTDAPSHSPTGEALDVSSLLEGSRLLVLGGTGFVGKVFWGMLLDRYPAVGQIYLLVRSSKERSSEGRFWAQVATSEPMEPLRKTHGAAFEDFLREKIVVIDGDVGKPDCGLDESVLRDLKGTIDAIVNVAGVVDFNPPLDEALDANARGTRNVVELAKTLGDVPLLHTSTCYTAGRRKGPIVETDPRALPFPRAGKPGESPTGNELPREIWDAERELAECAEIVREVQRRADDAFRQSEFEEEAKKQLRARGEPTRGEALDGERAKVRRKFVTEALVDAGVERANHWGWPNIYTYTKSLGEQLVAGSGLPFAIVRPACCESTVEFPFVGWNEGISTSAPIIYLIMKGQVQLPLGEVPLDLIPTDYVCAGMILALSELLEGRAKPVYQLGGSDVNACSVARFAELTGLYKRKYYQRKGTGNPFIDFFQAHIEPVAISEQRFDTWSSPAMGRIGRELARAMRKASPALAPAAKAIEGAAKREEKIGDILKMFAPFTAQQNGPFSCANVREAHARLSEADRAKLPWAPESIDWPSWFHTVHMPAMEKSIIPEMDRKMAREAKALKPHETLVALLEEMAERHAHAPALSRMEKERISRVTYVELRAQAWAVAARLAASGVKKGDRVVLSGKNHPDWVIAYFGILRAGAVAVPIDPALDEDARAILVGDCEAAAIISDAQLPHPQGLHGRSFDLHAVTGRDDALAPPALDLDGSDVASLLYTSGTTGKPKGVRLTHANFSSLVAALAPLFPLSGKDRVLSVLPLHHTFEFTCGLILPLSRGAHVMYLDELNGQRLADGLAAGKVTAMVGVPALWQLLERRIVSEIEARGPIAAALFQAGGELNRVLGAKLGLDAGRLLFGPVHAALGGELRWLISGGAALPKETHARFASMGLPLAEGYGLTEAGPVLTVAKGSPRAKPGHVGKAIPGVELKIANPDAEGVGEVIARGPNVMAGYTDDVATARAIDGQGWLHTGDLGRLDKRGQLVLVSRIKDVVVGPTGENVYPDDVEERVGSVPGVAELAIVGASSESGERVACLAVPEKDDDLDRAVRNERARTELRAAFDKIPYGQRPSIVHLSDQPLPRTATRKVKRDEVRGILARKMAATERTIGGGVTSEVRTAITVLTGVSALTSETTLQGDLGFDSLRLAELLEALETRGRSIEPAALQSCLTVGEVEALVGQEPALKPARATIEKGERAEVVLPPVVQELGKRFVGKLQDAFYGQVMKTRVLGRAFIPHNRATIVVANHSSHLDMGLVRHALGAYGEDIVSLAAQDYFFEGSGGGLKKAFFANLTNLVALDRQGGLRAALRQASDVVASGKTVLLFPEGTRSTTGELGEFKPMLGQLALTHGVDVLPVFLAGTHAAMPKGYAVPTKRDVGARIGPPLRVEDLRRLTAGMSAADAAREVAKLARAAVAALQAGKVLDLARTTNEPLPEEQHPLVTLFAELEEKFNPGAVERPVSFYFTLGDDELAKWTVKVDGEGCEVRPGKPDGGQADCVLKTSSEIFTKIVRESYVPGPSDFLSGAIKSNDVSLLLTFQKIFQLES